MGDTVVQLSTPNADGTIAAQDMSANNEVLHAAAFRAVDLDAAADYLASKGIATLARDDDTFLADPATTHGVPFRWTTWDVPGGPRDQALRLAPRSRTVVDDIAVAGEGAHVSAGDGDPRGWFGEP
jgi:hypothetical protein